MTFIKNHLEYVLLFLFSFIGISTLSGYGICWDEVYQRTIGEVCYNYIFNNDLRYLEFPDRDHGPLFEFILVLIEKTFNMDNIRNVYVMRHTVTHLFFLISALYFYKLIFFIYNKKFLALLGFLFLVVTPTIYGHSFFNTKDIPFLSMYIICFYQFAIAFKYKKPHQFMLLGLFSCFLINIRIMGVLFVLFVICFLIFDLFISKKEKGTIKKHLILLALFIGITIISTIIVWPLLWHNPLQNFVYVFKSLSKFTQGGIIFFKGTFIDSHNLRWDYTPISFCINTPIGYLILGFCGILLFIINLFKHLKTFNLQAIDKNNLLYLLSFFAPVCAIITLHSIVFDSWRHLFYIYPAFILLVIYFINLCMNTKSKLIIYAITVISISTTLFFMVSNYPFQHVYFNQFVSLHKGEYIRKNYEMDYWGVSYNKSLEYILSIDNRTKIYISTQNAPGVDNANILFEDQKKRLVFVDAIEKSDYFITNYRGHPEDYELTNLEEIKSFIVLNNKINTVFKVKK
jgi:hypothetical protein